MPRASEAPFRPIIVIHGGIGSGKTFFACTASEKFEGWPDTRHDPEKPLVLLEDLFLIAADYGAADGLAERGYDIEMFDLAGEVANGTPVDKGVSKALKAAKEYGPKFLVFDTVSRLDRFMEAEYREKGGDTRQMYGRMMWQHERVAQACRAVGAGVIFCCHSKSIAADDETRAARLKKETLKVAGGGDIIPDITGKGQLSYKADASVQFVVSMEKDRSGKKTRVALLGDPKREGKNRWELSLDDKEPADFRAIFKKVRGK